MRNLWHSTPATPAAAPCATLAAPAPATEERPPETSAMTISTSVTTSTASAPAPATEERLPGASATTTSTTANSTAAAPAPEEDPLDAFMRRIEAQAARPSRWDDTPTATTARSLVHQPSRSRWDDTPTAPPARTNASVSRSLWDLPPPPGYIPPSAANVPSNNPALAFLSRKSWQPAGRVPPSWLPGCREVALGPNGQPLPEEPRPCAVCDLYIDFLEVESGRGDDNKPESEEVEVEEEGKKEKANEEKSEGEEKRSEDDMEMEDDGGEIESEKCNGGAKKKNEKNEWTQLPCRCKVCKECFSKYVSVRCASVGLGLFRSSIMPFACPSCGRGTSTEATMANTSRDVADRLDALALKHALSRMADLRFCPAPDCGNALWIDPATDHGPAGLASQTRCVLKCDRDGCGTEFCFDCRAPWHEGLTCEESRQARESAEDAAAAAAGAVSASLEASGDQPLVVSNRECKAILKVKSCPQCGNETEKNGGCTHMTCVCGHEYCWECLSAFWEPHKEGCLSGPPRGVLNQQTAQKQKPPTVGATSRQPESQPPRPGQPKSRNAAPPARGPSCQSQPQPEAEYAETRTQPQPQPSERGPQPAQETPPQPAHETAKPGIVDIAPGKQKAEQESQPQPQQGQSSVEALLAGQAAHGLRTDDALIARDADAGVDGALAQPQPSAQARSPKPLSDTGDQEGEIQVALAELGQGALQLRRHASPGLPIAQQEPVKLSVVIVVVVSIIIAEPAKAQTAYQEAHDQPLTLVVEIEVEVAIAQSRHPPAAEKAAQSTVQAEQEPQPQPQQSEEPTGARS